VVIKKELKGSNNKIDQWNYTKYNAKLYTVFYQKSSTTRL